MTSGTIEEWAKTLHRHSYHKNDRPRVDRRNGSVAPAPDRLWPLRHPHRLQEVRAARVSSNPPFEASITPLR